MHHTRGAAPSRSTHAGRAPETAPRHHTQQSAHQAAIAAALELARQNAPHRPVVITVDSTTALRNLADARPTRPSRAEDAGGTAPTEAPPPAAQPPQATSPDRGLAHGAKRPLPRDEHPAAPPRPKRGRPNRRADKRSREQRDPLPLTGDHARQTIANASTLSQLHSRFGGQAVKLRVPTQAHPVDIAAAAAQAARLRDLMAHVTTAMFLHRNIAGGDVSTQKHCGLRCFYTNVSVETRMFL